MEEFRQQEEKQYDLLETGVYTHAKFEQRNSALRQKMEELQERIYKTKATMPQEVDYEEKVVTLQKAIEALKDKKVDAETKNRLLKSIVKRIELSTDSGGRNQSGLHLEFTMRL
jgi:DNA repair exonuclease SbcCD ATPase subunit